MYLNLRNHPSFFVQHKTLWSRCSPALIVWAALAALSLRAQTFDPAHAKTALLDQCPAMSAAGTADAPIHVDKWGNRGPAVLLIHGGVQGKLGGGPSTFDRQEALADMGGL